MKKQILKIALFLIEVKGNTTNLEIKNMWHSLNPGGDLTQLEVSDIMKELYSENLFKRSVVTANGFTFFSYTENVENVVESSDAPSDDDIPTYPQPTTPVDRVQEAIDAVQKEKDITSNIYAVVPAVSGKLQDATIGKLGDLSNTFLKSLQPNLYLAYSKNIQPFLFKTTDRFEARKLFKEATKEKHDNVRMIQVGHFVKKLGI